MLIKTPRHVPSQAMTMAGASGVQMRLMVGRQDGAPTFAMRLFEVEPGGHTPEHQHNYEHEVVILEGQGQVLDQERNTRPIQAGDVLFIPANEIHQFRNTSSTSLRFLCMVPVRFQCGKQELDTPCA